MIITRQHIKSEDFFINKKLAKENYLSLKRINELIERQAEILEWQDQMNCSVWGMELIEINEGICKWKNEDDEYIDDIYISSIIFHEVDMDNHNILVGVMEFGEELGYRTYKQNVVYNYKNNDLIIAE